VAVVARRVVDHEHIDLDVTPARLERRQTPLEVPAGVVVDDDDRQLGRPRVGHDPCGVREIKKMPIAMNATPPQRSAGTF
jgi:hypothetical protein